MYCYTLILLCTAFVVKADLRADFAAQVAKCGDFYTRHEIATPVVHSVSALKHYEDFVIMVKEQNARADRTWTAEVNCWSTFNLYLPLLPAEANEVSVGIPRGNSGDAPDSYDRRADNTTTPARSQGSCGSCWAFSGIAALEVKYLDLTGEHPKNVDFSEQQFLDCTYESNSGSDGCDGGWMTRTWSRLQSQEQSILYNETQRPYLGEDKTCNIMDLNKRNAMRRVVMKYPSYKQVGDSGITNPMGGDTQERIWLQGAIAIAIRVETPFYSYKSGIFTEGCKEKGVNHALTLIGYTQQAFIAQNSWGKSWGDKGHLKLSRTNGNLCEYLTYTMWPEMECAWGTAADGKCVRNEPCGGCQNNGRCKKSTAGVTKWECDCLDGFTGDKCQNSEDPCDGIDCLNDGKCRGGKCYCQEGWSGERCEKEDTADCDKKCKNNKVCYWKSSTKMGCRCPGATYGKTCDMKSDCSNDDPKMCEKKKGKWSKDKWTKKCLKNWGKKKCPHTCGYCRSSYGHLGYGGY